MRVSFAAMVLLLVGSLLILPCGAKSSVLFSEDFEGILAGESHGGGTLPLGSGLGSGWQADLLGEETEGYLSIPVREGVDYSTERGTLEFWLKNDRLGGVPYRKADIYYNTVVEWIGPGWYLPIYFLGSSDRAEDESALVVWGHRYIDGANPYGFYIHLGRRIALGEWVHVAFTWGPEPSANALYINGVPLELEVPVDQRVNFGSQLKGASTLVVGADLMDSTPGGIYHLANAVVDDIQLHDEVVTAFDMTRLKPSILAVTTDAFAVAGYSGKLVAGDKLTVTLKADPGGAASFDLVQPSSTAAGVTTPEKVRAAGIPMTEVPNAPGTYVGTHTVRYGENLQEGRIVGHFTNAAGVSAKPVSSDKPVTIDTKVTMAVKPSSDLIPADRSSRAGLTITAADANGRKIRDHRLELTLSTTDEYTGILGGSSFEDAVGGSLDVDWGGVTDSFGEVTAQLVSGFAAKTMVVSARDMVSGDVGVGWVRSFIDGSVEIKVLPARTSALSFAGSMELSTSREWLTADGRSRSRITAVVKDASGNPLSGHTVSFSLLGSNGSIRAIQSRTDARGRAYADYIAGTKMGQVTIDVRDATGGLFGSITIELRPDAPAKIALTADPAEVYVGGDATTVTAEVLDINDNPNRNVDVSYDISVDNGKLSASRVATDKDGKASVQFVPGDAPGVVTIRGTVTSRTPTPEEISAAEGAAFLYGLAEDPGVLEVTGWRVAAGDEVAEGQDLVTLTDRRGTVYTVKAPRDGKVSVFAAEEGDEVRYGDTLAYILLVEEK